MTIKDNYLFVSSRIILRSKRVTNYHGIFSITVKENKNNFAQNMGENVLSDDFNVIESLRDNSYFLKKLKFARSFFNITWYKALKFPSLCYAVLRVQSV